MPHLLKTISLTALIAMTTPLAAQETEAEGAGTQGAEGTATGGAENGTDGAETPATDDAGSGAESEAAPADGDQTAPAEGGASGLSMGEEVDGAAAGEDASQGVGSTYTQETFGDWEQRCVRTEDENDPCQLYQLLADEQGNAVAEISLFALPEEQQAAAGATVITPLETLLTRQITLAVDGNAAKRYPFDFCAPQGCFARIGFTDADVQAFKRGAVATITIVPAAAPDQEIGLDVSLSGFTDGYDAVAAANAE